MSNRICKILTDLNSKLDNSIFRISKRNVPHLVIDSYYSVAYFGKSNKFRIFEGYATLDSHSVCDVKTAEEVIEFFKKDKEL